MNKVFTVLLFLLFISCSKQENSKIPVYAWLSGPGNASDTEILLNFEELEKKGVDGLMYSAGHNPETYRRVAKIAKEAGLEFHTWIPTLVQGKEGLLDHSLYAINRLGESAWDKPAYVSRYKFICPNHEEVYEFLDNLYGSIADIPDVDGIHLDYIRYPDAILPPGLWEKFDIVMDREYPEFDYCYCDKCVAEFKEETGIDILAVEDPSQLEEWKQFRCDEISGLVNKLADMVHSKGKVITAAVFPGPASIARKIVSQEWDKWNLDAFYPMNYNDFYLEGTEWIGDVCKEAVVAIDNRKPVYSGLFICPEPEKKVSEQDPENHGLVPEEIEDAIRESMENGAAGICLFTPGRMTKEGWKAFEKAIHQKY